LLGAGIVFAAVIALAVTLLQWKTSRRRTTPRSAPIVVAAPQVSGTSSSFAVRDSQQVKQGDLLFLIDRVRTEIALARAQAALA